MRSNKTQSQSLAVVETIDDSFMEFITRPDRILLLN